MSDSVERVRYVPPARYPFSFAAYLCSLAITVFCIAVFVLLAARPSRIDWSDVGVLDLARHASNVVFTASFGFVIFYPMVALMAFIPAWIAARTAKRFGWYRWYHACLAGWLVAWITIVFGLILSDFGPVLPENAGIQAARSQILRLLGCSALLSLPVGGATGMLYHWLLALLYPQGRNGFAPTS